MSPAGCARAVATGAYISPRRSCTTRLRSELPVFLLLLCVRVCVLLAFCYGEWVESMGVDSGRG